VAEIKFTADTSQAERAVESLKRAIGGIGAAVVGASLFKLVDDLQNMQNKLLIASKSTEEFNQSMAYVKAIADKTGQSLQATGDLYAAVSRNAEKLGYNTAQVATVTNAMATALKASGASAEGSRSVMYQFSQILAKGKVNGDEFTTIMENLGGPVMDLVAKNMGVTTAELMKLKEKGLIGAKDFTDALIRSMGELDNMSGKALPTLGQNLQRIQNSFSDFVIGLDKATGFTTILGDAMSWLAKNIDVVLPLIASFVGFWVGARIGAIALELYEVVKAVRAVGIAAAVTEALATGGVSAITALAGAAAAYAGAELLFDKVDKSVTKTTVDLKQAGVEAQKGVGNTAGQLQGVGDKYKEILKDLNAQVGLSKVAADQYQIENQILTYKKQLEGQMTAAQEKQIRNLLQMIEFNKQMVAIDKALTDDAKMRVVLNIEDVAQRKIATELESARKQYGEAAFAARKGELEAAIKQNVADEASRNIRDAVKNLEQEINLLTIADVKQREIEASVLAKRNELGSAFTGELEKQYRATLQIAQANKEIDALRQRNIDQLKNLGVQPEIDALKLYRSQDKTGGQGYGETLNKGNLDRAIQGVIGQGSKELAIRSEYSKKINDLEIIQLQLKLAGLDKEFAYEKQITDAITQLKLDANYALDELDSQRFQEFSKYEDMKVQRAAETYAATLRMQKDIFGNEMFNNEQIKQIAVDRANFEKQTELQKSQFVLEQGIQIFSALGAQNKKAFEAAKAFNIANAIMNTYMGATKALATYPWPFGLIAAAAAVATGMAQVAAIRSQNYSGRALGGPVMGNSPYIVGENGPELFTPNTAGRITRNQDLGGGATTINFNIQANDAQGFDDLLIQRRGMITQMISDAMVEKGQRVL